MEDNVKADEQEQIATNNIPLFIKKLWKIVNDKDAENIISWNDTGDSFVIHDQIEFIKNLLPHYFKHNNMASFVRQLNFYNFHKVPNVQNEVQFAHPCFLKDVPEILPFIRRKNPVVKQKSLENQQEVQDLLVDIKNLKGKHTLVDKELAMLKEENVTLWNEINSLRMKYTKQSTIINMLVHFLITYIHSHQTSFSKSNIQVSANNSGKNNIKVGPQLLEIGYKNNKKNLNKSTSTTYSALEPGTSSVTYSVNFPKNTTEPKRLKKNVHTLEEMLGMEDQTYSGIKRPKNPQGLTYSIHLPQKHTPKLSQTEIQKSLLEILRENERLCEEDSEDMVTELNDEVESLRDVKDTDEEVEEEEEATTNDIVVNTEDGSYTISYPAEFIQNSNNEESSDTTQNQNSYTENSIKSPDRGSNPKTPTEYTVTYPEEFKKFIKIPDSVPVQNPASKAKVKPKFIKIPVKNLKNANILVPVVNVEPKDSGKIVKNIQQTVPTAQEPESSNLLNPKGAPTEILKPTEDSSVKNIPNMQVPSIDKSFDNFLLNSDSNQLSSDPVVSEASTKKIQRQKSFNILENPKENLGSYLNETQEEIEMLQDILNNLTSTDLSDILSSDSQLLNDNSTTQNTDDILDIPEYIDPNLLDLESLQ